MCILYVSTADKQDLQREAQQAYLSLLGIGTMVNFTFWISLSLRNRYLSLNIYYLLLLYFKVKQKGVMQTNRLADV